MWHSDIQSAGSDDLLRARSVDNTDDASLRHFVQYQTAAGGRPVRVANLVREFGTRAEGNAGAPPAVP